MFKPVTISSNGEDTILEKRKIMDIFKFYTTPYICTAMSGKGKTTLAIDLIYSFAKECSNVYYITATKESMTDDSISLIPKAFRREPTFENMQNAWNEIVGQNEAINAQPEKLTELIIKIYGEEVAKTLNKQIETQKNIIRERNSKIYKQNGDSKDVIQQKIKNDMLAFTYEIKRRVILFAFKEFNDLDEKLTIEETSIVNAFISKPPRTLLILDDVTSELERLKSDTNKVLVNDSYVSKSKAFQSLLTDILTRARHFNCMVVFFVHSIDIFDCKDKIDRLVMFDSSMTQKLNNLKSFDQKMKHLITQASDKLFGNKDYDHMFLYYSRSGKDICVGKASLHISDQLEISDSSKKYIELYNNVLSGFKDTSTDVIENHETESEEYEEDNGVL